MRILKEQIAFLAVAAMAVWLPAALADEGLVSKTNDHQGKSLEHWSSAEGSTAEPMPLRTREGVPLKLQQFAPPGPAGSALGALPGNLASGSFSPRVSVEAGGIEPKIFGGTQWYGYPPPHTRYFPRFGNTLYPHSTLGKLFFSDGFSNFVCSGAAVVCGNLNLVMTAGHCCAAGDGFTFYDDFLFVPACTGANCNVAGSAPFGRWDWQSVSVPNSWFFFGDLARDVCFLETAPNGSFQQLHQVTGSLGLAWNQTQPIHYTMTGWPAATPFTGANLVFELGSTADLDGSLFPNTVGVGNFMTGGSSGGGWIKDYKQGIDGTNQFWNGLNSYHYVNPARPAEMYGPYIDTTIFNLWASLGCQ